MPDLKQALKDFVATSNSGKYSDEETLISKFPELQGYDIQVLKDFVATSNSGQYATEEELFSKFPEFNTPIQQPTDPVKKKDTGLLSGGGSLASRLSTKPKNETLEQVITPPFEPSLEEMGFAKLNALKKVKEEEEEDSFLDGLGKNVMAGLNDFNKMITSVPESIYNIFSIPQNAIAYATGLDIATDADKFKKVTGITNPIYDTYKKEGERLEKEISEFNEQRYQSSSIFENIQEGNYSDAFELLGSGIARSAPTSLAIMAGGATLKTGELTSAITTAFYNQNLEELKEENPDASAIENNIKALGMSAAEGVFSSIGTGQIGAIYRDIIKKEGVEVGSKIFKDGLSEAYKGALKKYGIPIGALGEGIEESATQITQNMISGKPAFQGAADAFILGAGSGVVFTAPISLKNAKDRIKNNVEKSKDDKEIVRILDGQRNDFVKIYDVSKNDQINEKQLEIASLSKSRDILVDDLSKSLKKGEITKEQASQSLFVFDKTQQITGQLRDTNLDEQSKLKVANLLKEREALNEKISGKEDVLSVLEKERIEQINNEIKDVFLNSKPEYVIDNKKYTKEEFIGQLEGKTQEELSAMNIVVNNDQATSNIVTEKFKTDAIQKQGTQEEVAKPLRDVESTTKALEGLLVEERNIPLSPLDLNNEGIITWNRNDSQSVAEAYHKAKKEGSNVELIQSVEELLTPKITEQVTQPQGEVTQPQGEVTQTIIESLNDVGSVFVYDGKKGQLTTIGQTVVLETPTEIIDLGNVDELSDSTLDDFGIQKEQELNIELNEDNSVFVNDKTYLNNYSNPDSAISQDKDGNYSVTLDTENGQKRTFRGQQADQIVYQMKLKNFEQNGTEQDIDTAIELANEAIRIEEEVGQPSPEREGKSVRKGKRKQRTLKTVKEPLTKSEREETTAEPKAEVAPETKAAPIINRVSELEKENNADITNDFDNINRSENKSLGGETVEFSFEGSDGNIYKVKTLVDDAIGYIGLTEVDGNVRSKFKNEAEAHYRKLKQEKVDSKETDIKTKDTLQKGIIKEIERELETNERSYKQRDEGISIEFFESLSGGSITRKQIDAEIQKIPRYKAELKAEYEAKKAELEKQLQEVKDKLGLKKEAPKTEEAATKKEKSDVETGADLLDSMNENERDTFIDDWYEDRIPRKDLPGGNNSILLYEARKIAPKQEGKLKRVTIDNSFNLSNEVGFVIKVDGEVYGLSKYDNPDATSDKQDSYGDPKDFVWAFTDLKTGETTETFESDVNELVKEIRNNKPTEAKDLLNLDTKDKTNLQRVSDYLEKMDRALDMNPNELNDVTRVMAIATAKAVIKTLKALVNAGVTLQRAIEMASEAHKVKPSQIIDALDIVSKINENKSEGISEMEAPGFNTLSKEIDNMISNESTIDEVLDYTKASDVYKNATDVQRDLLVRDVRKRFGLRQKSAPSVAKLFGTIKDVKKITMREKDLLVKQLKDKAKASKDAIIAWKKISQELSKEIKELRGAGKITTTQAANALRAFSKVNLFSQKSVDGFVDYMTKVFENADYADNLKNAKKLRASIKELSKNKDRNADLRTLGSEFINIDPALVDNIFDYNETAAKIKKAIEGSSKRKDVLNVADTVNIQETSEYVNKTLEEQKKIIEKQQADELQELLGVDVSQLSAEEIVALLGKEEKIDLSKEDEKIVRAAVKKAFDIYSSMIKKSLTTGLDVFTDEQVEYTNEQKKLISEFMKMDTDKMNIKESISAIDSLINFLVNKSTAKMEAVVNEYIGEQNAIEVENSKITKTPLKKLFSENFAKFLGEQITTLPILFEKKFKGFNAAGYVMDKMGLNQLINKKSLAQKQANTIVNDYVNLFYKKTANNQKFNTIFNTIERGMTSFMIRNVVGTEAKMQEEFDRRKGLVQQSIDALSNGSKKEKAKAKVYKEVYDKILSESKNANDVISNVDSNNLDAVNWWIEKWDSKFDKLSDVAKNIYNKTLNRELNYTPDKYSRIDFDRTETDLSNDESAFINNTDGVLYKKETGVLMDKKASNNLPQNKKGNPISYINLSFDKNNANSMYDALVDVETAPAIRQVQSFMDSNSFEKIFGDDAQIFKNRIKLYVQKSRKKNPFSDDELSKTIRALNKIAAIGASQALAGPTQPFKQVIPVIANTLINTKGKLDVLSPFNKNFNTWLDEQGYAISNRGVDSQAQIDSVNRLIDEAANSNLEKAGKLIEEANKKYISFLLAKPDVYIARASWKAYYEQSLKKQGKLEKEIDYSDHEINKEAANYAQRMVDRQQNISDTDLSGKLFSSQETGTQFLVKTLMPFASFRMNQSSRLAADLTTLGYWNTATAEDKAIAVRSLVGFTVEQLIFKSLSAGFGLGIYAFASMFMKAGDEEEEKDKKVSQVIKGAATGAVTDVFSPLPIADRLVQWSAAEGLNLAQDMMNLSESQKVSLYSPKDQSLLQSLGMFGITGTRAVQASEVVQLYATGKYEDSFGNVKTISSSNREKMGQLIGPSILTGFGLLPPEAAGFIRNSVKIAKKGETDKSKALLGKYKNKTEMKEDNPELYKKNFGEGSPYYRIQEREKKIKERDDRIKERLKKRNKKFGAD